MKNHKCDNEIQYETIVLRLFANALSQRMRRAVHGVILGKGTIKNQFVFTTKDRPPPPTPY